MRRGNLADARRFLQFAIQFTPQYGDSFVESLRLEMIEKGPHADTHDLEQVLTFLLASCSPLSQLGGPPSSFHT